MHVLLKKLQQILIKNSVTNSVYCTIFEFLPTSDRSVLIAKSARQLFIQTCKTFRRDMHHPFYTWKTSSIAKTLTDYLFIDLYLLIDPIYPNSFKKLLSQNYNKAFSHIRMPECQSFRISSPWTFIWLLFKNQNFFYGFFFLCKTLSLTIRKEREGLKIIDANNLSDLKELIF